jgi:hypothetical protein
MVFTGACCRTPLIYFIGQRYFLFGHRPGNHSALFLQQIMQNYFSFPLKFF